MRRINDTLLHEKLKEYFGFTSFKGNQKEVVESVLNGDDAFVLMPTGGGKSLCYQFPALLMDGVAIVISPLIALMKNQVDAIRSHTGDDSIAHFINSSLTKAEVDRVKEDVLAKKTKLLYFAPESLTKEDNVAFLRSIEVSFYAIDEAHCISEWGHDFRPEYRRIRPIINEIGKASLIALTATATPKVQMDIQKNLEIQDAPVFKSSFNRPNLYYEIKGKHDVDRDIIKFVKERGGRSGIVYCLSRKKVEETARLLQTNDIKALPYHAGMDAATRAEHQDMFLNEDVDVIVATIAFGMGIDKPDIRFVVHYDIPKSLEGYYQETGRAGRDGGVGECLTFYSYQDIQKLEKFMQGKPLNEQEIGKLLLQETVSYVESSLCRRKTLMNYFGETYPKDYCGSCDNCLKPKEKSLCTKEMQLALQTLTFIGDKFKTDYLLDMLVGRETTLNKSYEHHKSDFFGKGRKETKTYWGAVVRNASILHFIDKDIENYGLLSITERGKEFVEKPFEVYVSPDHDYDTPAEGGESTSHSEQSGAGDELLLKMLLDLRKKVARKHELPPFVIFQESSLEDMTIQYPITLDEMQNITGVGRGKARKFGRDFIKLIEQYVEDNDIIRPDDLIVKTIADKSADKIYIIQSIDRQIDFKDIAKAKNLEIEEVIGEVEAIVSSGTVLNINYYIDRTMEPDRVEDIYYYFKDDAQSSSLDEAMNELGNEYSEEEVRLVRIKFFSEEGN